MHTALMDSSSSKLLPAIVDRGDVELVGHYPPRLAGAVGHRHDFHPVNTVESGNVPVAGVPPRANKPDFVSLRQPLSLSYP